jgi:hypothetical protein
MAIDELQLKTQWKFIQRTNEFNYIEFINGPGCFSKIGKAYFGKQQIIFNQNCGERATVHELCHAIGMVHEHQRSIRDEYIEVYPDNVEDGRESQYAKLFSLYEIYNGPYDINSIMHYNNDTFAKNNTVTFSVKGNNMNVSSTRQQLTERDIMKLNLLRGEDGGEYKMNIPYITILLVFLWTGFILFCLITYYTQGKTK